MITNYRINKELKFFNLTGDTTITADSAPVYFSNYGVGTILNPTAWFSTGKLTDKGTGKKAWEVADWIAWYNANKSKYGVAIADSKWGNAWLDGMATVEGGNANSDTGAGTIYSSVPFLERTSNVDFKAFMDKNPYIKNVVFNGIMGTSAQAASATVDVAKDIGSGVAQLGSGLGNSIKIAGYVMPALVILAGAGIIWYAYKNFLKTTT